MRYPIARQSARQSACPSIRRHPARDRSGHTASVSIFEPLESRQLLSASLLQDISAGNTSSLPDKFNILGNQVLFTAYDATRGQMLWSTDGTAAGTTLIKDLNPNPQTGKYVGFGGDSIVIGNELYFTGADAAHGVELWKSDGTSDGTQLVEDLNPGTDSSYPQGFVNFDGKLAFEAMSRLWITDGTSAGTVSVGAYSPLGNGGAVDRMTVMNGKLYFMRYGASSPDGHSTGELWQTDGTVNGTSMVVDISPGNDGQSGISSEPSNLITIGNKLYFAADDGTHGWELYQSDGTAIGTSMVADLAPPPNGGIPVDGSYPGNLTNVNGQLYFTASPDYGPQELYRLDPTTGQPTIVLPIASGGPASAQNLTVASGMLYFTATDSTNGSELWRSDGTAAGTHLVKDINPGTADSAIADLTAIGSRLVFSADDGTHGNEVWISDGSSAGTTLLADVQPGATGSNPASLLDFQGRLLLTAQTTVAGREPYVIALPPPPAPVTTHAVGGAHGISRNPFPVLQGTALAGSTVYLFADGVKIGTTTAALDGTFSVTSSVALHDGKHVLSASDQTAGQTSTASVAMNLLVDTTPPTARLLAATKTELDVRFSEDVSATLGRGDFTITDNDTGAVIPASKVRVAYNKKTNTAQITFRGLKGGALGTGHYRLRFVSSRVDDVAGNQLAASSFGYKIVKKKKK